MLRTRRSATKRSVIKIYSREASHGSRSATDRYHFTVDEMMKHVARFKEQKSTSKSFIDMRIPVMSAISSASSVPAC